MLVRMNLNIKRCITITIVICCILIVSLTALIDLYNKYNNIKDIRLHEISKYLNENFDEPIEKIDISVIGGCTAQCKLVNNPDFQFIVVCWEFEKIYIDTYFQTHLKTRLNI